MTKAKLIKNLNIKVPVYYYIDDADNKKLRIIHVDEEEIVREFNDQLDNIMEMFDEQDADSE
jgi:hypothetical protein